MRLVELNYAFSGLQTGLSKFILAEVPDWAHRKWVHKTNVSIQVRNK